MSAVLGVTLLTVACGVGVVAKLPLVRGRTSELDFLKPVSGGLGAASLP